MQDEKYDIDIEEILDKKMEEFVSNINKKKRKKKIFIVSIFFSIFLVALSLIIMFLSYGGVINWFENYDGMYLTELPIEEPAQGGVLYIPNNWKFVEKDGWYSIIDLKDNRTIAYEIYHGYWLSNNSYENKFDYELNPVITYYDNINFEVKYTSLNGNQVLESSNYYKVYIFEVCQFKSKSLRDRIYSKEYLFNKEVGFELLKKIVKSYSTKIYVE